jgi:hypothetical protein
LWYIFLGVPERISQIRSFCMINRQIAHPPMFYQRTTRMKHLFPKILSLVIHFMAKPDKIWSQACSVKKLQI